MTFLFESLKPLPESLLSWDVAGSVNVAWPVVMTADRVPVDVTSVSCPLGRVVRVTTVNASRDVETRALVLTIADERGAEVAAGLLEAAGWPALVRAALVGVACPPPFRLLLAAGACEDCAGGAADVSGSGVESGVVDAAGVGVGSGCADDAGGGAADEAGGAADVGVLLLPVPDACLETCQSVRIFSGGYRGISPLHAMVNVLLHAVEVEGRRQRNEGKERQ
jgi:hypothetical protein